MNHYFLLIKLALKGWQASLPRLNSVQIFLLLALAMLMSMMCYALHQAPAILQAAPPTIQAIKAPAVVPVATAAK